MGRFGNVVLQGLLIIFLQGCGSLLTKIEPEQSIPADRYFSITDYKLSGKQQLSITLHDFSNELICDNYEVEPDSIVCYIDSFLTTPTLIVSEIFIERTEYRFNHQQPQYKGSHPGNTGDPDGRFATINYRIPVTVYRFSFPSLRHYESMIPEKLRSKIQVWYPPPLQLQTK